MEKFSFIKQRKLIIDELKKLKSHLTADELYNILRKKMPKISMGTVYRNLEIMSEAGIIKKLEHSTQKRFDGDTTPHYHFRCKNCGHVYDIDFFESEKINKVINSEKEHNITGFNLEFEGICKNCLNS